MNILTRKEDDVVVYIANTAETVSNGILVDDNMVFGNADQYNVFENVTVPNGINVQEYKYTSSGGFVKNTSYVPYLSIEEKVNQLCCESADPALILSTVFSVIDSVTAIDTRVKALEV